MLTLIHTGDWHLGQTLHGYDRSAEHRAFCAHLLDRLETSAADALLIAGDVFDSANPPAEAQALFYETIVAARLRCPGLQIVVIAGNHDSGARLAAPAGLARPLGAHLIGTLARTPDGAIDPAPHLITLTDRQGRIAARLCAIPFLRPVDLPPASALDETAVAAEGEVAAGMRQVIATLADALAAQRRHGEAALFMAHAYLTGGQISALSERKIQMGNQQALPLSAFPEDATYIALGHLHLAQGVGGCAHVRYAGSPIPLALDEADYPHQLVRIDIDAAGGLAGVTALPVPRSVEIIRLPQARKAPPLDPASLDRALAALPAHDPAADPAALPYLDLAVAWTGPGSLLRDQVQQGLKDRGVRLARLQAIGPEAAGLRGETESPPPARLDPEAVFIECWRRAAAGREDALPPAPLLTAFRQLLESVHHA